MGTSLEIYLGPYLRCQATPVDSTLYGRFGYYDIHSAYPASMLR